MLYPDTGRRSLVQYLSGSTGEPDGRTENRRMFMDTIGEAVLRSCQPYVITVFNSVVVLNIMRTTHIVSMVLLIWRISVPVGKCSITVYHFWG